MLKLFGTFLNLFIILIIFSRLPQESGGLESFANKSNLLGSPSSAQRFLNVLTIIVIFLDLFTALQLNLTRVY